MTITYVRFIIENRRTLQQFCTWHPKEIRTIGINYIIHTQVWPLKVKSDTAFYDPCYCYFDRWSVQ